jgi:hypothetical protein
MTGEENPIEALRRSFRPQKIATLFVGESAPISGKFFYDRNTNFYRYVKQALDGGENFLEEFKAKGFFLDDLVLKPINGMSQKERRHWHKESEPFLTERIASYKPHAVISVMKDIHDVVADAIRKSGVQNVTHYCLPFPGQGHQTKFIKELRRISAELPMASQV